MFKSRGVVEESDYKKAVRQLRERLDEAALAVDNCFLPQVSLEGIIKNVEHAADEIRRARGIAYHRL